MNKNYIKVALRNLIKHKGYSVINISGLALGMACCMLAFLFVRNEFSYDQYHEHVDDVYQVTSNYKTMSFSSTPDPLLAAARERLPEVVNGARVWSTDGIIRLEDDVAQESFTFVDPAFLSVFTIPFQYGDAGTVLDRPYQIVLSADMALRYFGSDHPVGKTISVDLGVGFQDVQVTGVTEAVPGNTSIEFDFLLPFEQSYQYRDPELRTSWDNYNITTWLQLRSDVQPGSVEAKFPELIETYMAASIQADGEALTDYGFKLGAFADYRLGNVDDMGGYGLTGAGDPEYVYLLLGIALLVLLIAGFNFMNLSVGQASGRLREIGVRKVLGARRRQLIQQFGLEAVLLSFLAMLVGILLVELMLPAFNNVAGTDLRVRWLQEPEVMLVLSALSLGVGVLSGGYPALILSRIGSVEVFKGKMKFGGSNVLTRTLVMIQFGCTITFIICAGLMYMQQRYLHDTNLGYDREQVLMVSTQTNRSDPEAGRRMLEQFKQELAGVPNIVRVAGTSDAFTKGTSTTMKVLPDSSRQILFVYRVDDNFIPTLDMELTAGRNFSSEFATDADQGIIVNEAFVQTLNLEQPVGAVVPFELAGIDQPRIIGVVKDFHFQNLKTRIYPAFLHQRRPWRINYLLVKIAPEHMSESVETVRQTWRHLRPGQPFIYEFLDEAVDAQYQSEESWNRAIAYASLLAVIIACLGLLGLTSLSVARRTKEIGIRKVMGSTVGGIVMLLSREFIWLVLGANLVAWPVAYLSMQRWLETFAYSIEINPWLFAGAGLITLLPAWIAVGFHSVKAARANPVDALRYE